MSVADYVKALPTLTVQGLAVKVDAPNLESLGLSSDSEGDNLKHVQEQITRVELVDITQREKSYGRPTITLTSAHVREKADRSQYDDYAMVLRRRIDRNDNHILSAVEVHSPIIRRVLKHLLASYAYINLDAVPIIIPQPYDVLFHYRVDIRQYASAPERSEEELLHLSVLIDFMAINISPIEREWAQMVPKQRITFNLLWILFRPEDDLIVQSDHYNELLRIISCEYKATAQGGRVYEIEAWRWGYNASKFGPAQERILINEFSSTKKITQIGCFPLKQLPRQDRDSLYAKMIERGRKWKSLIGPEHRQYAGPLWAHPAKAVTCYETSRIILDHKLHLQAEPALADALIGANGFVQRLDEDGQPINEDGDHMSTRLRRLLETNSDDTTDQSSRLARNRRMLINVKCHDDSDDYIMSDEEAALCPSRVRGFSLASKVFAYFLVDNVRPVSFSDGAFYLLELDTTRKDTIRALVEMHNSSAIDFDDFVANKGKGVIMSLEGPPGSGKTLTAESVAELTHKPLYVISTNELGSTANEAEPALKKIFDRAKVWDAVLLLDEADLFLSKRTADDMERNAFVTIFLRLLEYYEGIMFLTTNRVEEYDPAFASRIHLKVKFSAPSAKVRASIWKNFLQRIDACRDWEFQTYDRLGNDLQLNGREIKNVIKVALVIAKHRKVPLSEEIVRQVFSMNYGSSEQCMTELERSS